MVLVILMSVCCHYLLIWTIFISHLLFICYVSKHSSTSNISGWAPTQFPAAVKLLLWLWDVPHSSCMTPVKKKALSIILVPSLRTKSVILCSLITLCLSLWETGRRGQYTYYRTNVDQCFSVWPQKECVFLTLSLLYYCHGEILTKHAAYAKH